MFYCSSSPNGEYCITIGNVTWKTRCKMNRIPGCGRGVWELLMRINGSMVWWFFFLGIIFPDYSLSPHKKTNPLLKDSQTQYYRKKMTRNTLKPDVEHFFELCFVLWSCSISCKNGFKICSPDSTLSMCFSIWKILSGNLVSFNIFRLNQGIEVSFDLPPQSWQNNVRASEQSCVSLLSIT